MAGEALERAVDQTPQTLFEKLFQSSPDAIVVTDSKGQITEVNAQVERIFGYSRQELLGQGVEVLIPERFRQIHIQHRAEYSGQPHNRPMEAGFDLYGRRKDGSEFPADIMLSPLETARDRSVLRGVRAGFHRSEQQLRLLLESAKNYAVCLLDLEGRIATWSPGAERVKGYKPKEVVGHHYSCFFTAEDVERGRPEEELRIAVERGHFEEESWRLRKDGSRFWAQTLLTGIRDTTGKVKKVLMVTCDLTERKEAENALVLELSNAVLSNLDAGQLFSAISKGVRHLMSCDVVTLGLYDPETNQMRVQPVD